MPFVALLTENTQWNIANMRKTKFWKKKDNNLYILAAFVKFWLFDLLAFSYIHTYSTGTLTGFNSSSARTSTQTGNACKNKLFQTRLSWPRGYKIWVHSQTQNKAQWLVACGHVSASSQSLHFILSLRQYSSFITLRPVYGLFFCFL